MAVTPPVATTNLPQPTAFDEVLGNQTADGILRTGRLPVSRFATQLAAQAPFSQLIGASAGGMKGYPTEALLAAETAPEAGTLARVYADPDPQQNGTWRKTGAAGQPGWQILPVLAERFIALDNAGAGTGDAIELTSNFALPDDPYGATFQTRVRAPNTGPVTIAVNGASPRPLVTAAGNPLEADYLKLDMPLQFVDGGADYRMTSTASDAAIQASVEGLRNEAEAFRDQAQTANSQAAGHADDAASFAGYRNFQTIDLFEADASLSYAGGNPVSAGDVVRARKEGLSFTVADQAEANPHNQNANAVPVKVFVNTMGNDEAYTRQFGCVGNGVADDDDRFTVALNALAAGEFRRLHFGRQVCAINERIVIAAMAADAEILATRGGGIKAVNTTSLQNLIDITLSGKSLAVRDITFDGQNNVPAALEVRNTDDFDSLFEMSGCRAHNFFLNPARDAGLLANADAVRVRGGYRKTVFDNNEFDRVRRGNMTVAGYQCTTSGIVVFQQETAGEWFYAQEVIHTRNRYNRIDSDEPAGRRGDHDCLKVFTAVTTGAAAPHRPTHIVSHGNSYWDCPGRAIKLQGNHAEISNETIVRKNVTSNDGGSTDIDMQAGGGSVKDCVFHYGLLSNGASPLTPEGFAGYSSIPISTYYNRQVHDHTIGAPTVEGITIYNDVDVANSGLEAFWMASRSGLEDTYPISLTARSIKMVRGRTKHMMITPTTTAVGQVFVHMENCYAEHVTTSMLDVGSGGTQARVFAQSNVQLSGTDVPVMTNYGGTAEALCFVNGMGNVGFTSKAPSAANLAGAKSVAAARANSLFPINQDDTYWGQTGGFNHETYVVDVGAIVAVRPMGYNQGGIYFLVADTSVGGVIAFAQQGSGVFDLTGNPASIYELTGGTNNDVAGKINVWFVTDGLRIKNNTAAARRIYVACLG